MLSIHPDKLAVGLIWYVKVVLDTTAWVTFPDIVRSPGLLPLKLWFIPAGKFVTLIFEISPLVI